MSSPCPNCRKGSKCGCGSCISRNGFDEETQIFDTIEDLIVCPHCKIGSSPDAWLDSEVAEMKENGVWNVISYLDNTPISIPFA